MALYIKDDAVDELAAKVQKATGARSKTDAVRTALTHELERIAAGQNFDTRNADLLAKADAFGQRDPDFDMKQFTDEMWGDI